MNRRRFLQLLGSVVAFAGFQRFTGGGLAPPAVPVKPAGVPDHPTHPYVDHFFREWTTHGAPGEVEHGWKLGFMRNIWQPDMKPGLIRVNLWQKRAPWPSESQGVLAYGLTGIEYFTLPRTRSGLERCVLLFAGEENAVHVFVPFNGTARENWYVMKCWMSANADGIGLFNAKFERHPNEDEWRDLKAAIHSIFNKSLVGPPALD
jgi:hypothetical protein